jgi:hypothetical protein
MAEMQVILATLMSHYHFEVTNDAELTVHMSGVTISPKKLQAVIQRR